MPADDVQIKEWQRRIALYEDMKAYGQVYDCLFDGLHRFCFAFVKSSEVAEEIVSDVFIKLWQIRNRLHEVSNLKVYLYAIARNLSLNYIQRHYTGPVISLDDIAPETMIETGNPEEICISADTLEAIRVAIRQLPPQCRIIFQLVKEEGLTYREVADVLHISPLTARNQVAIATRKILQLLPSSLLPANDRGRTTGE